MTKKRKPEGRDWEAFVDQWYADNHDEKIALACLYNVSYETAKHWISESGATRKQVEEEPKMTITVPELLAMRPSVHLDFVSFDIETSNLDADFSILLTACIKPYGQPAIVFRADDYPEWKANRDNDKPITVAIANELRKHAIIVGHYSQRFDIPFFRAKMVKHGLEPLPLMFGVDTWRIARNNFKVSSRRLANLANYFDLGDKHPVEGRLWMKAAYAGAEEAMDEIVEHNIMDVDLLEQLTCISFPFLKSIPKL